MLALGTGCSDHPVEALPDAGISAPALPAFEALGIETSNLEGIDLAALAQKVDLEAARKALEAPPAATATKRGGKRIVVREGESIQAAVEAAEPGATIWIRPGIYEEAVRIHKPLHLIGWPGHRDRVIIKNPGGEHNGIFVGLEREHAEEEHDHLCEPGRYVEDVVIANLTVEGFEENGVLAECTDGLALLRLTARDNGEYGLYPVLSKNGLIAFSSASGSFDAGLYVGQSENYAIVHSEAFDNVIGIEVENCRHIAVAHNRAYANNAGMLAVLLPPSDHIQRTYASELHVLHNEFTDNNAGIATEEEFAGLVPVGSGLLVVGFDLSHVAHNRVSGNAFIGIGLGSTELFLRILMFLRGNSPEEVDETITYIRDVVGLDLDPDHVRIRHNVLRRNGTLAESPLPSGLPGVPALEPADLLWDGTGEENCWEKNVFDTFYSPLGFLPECDAEGRPRT